VISRLTFVGLDAINANAVPRVLRASKAEFLSLVIFSCTLSVRLHFVGA
jgi:hypothetical protein